jgi:hypothetical protein
MGATFSKVIDNIKTKHEVESKPLKDENITHFEFIIEEDIIEESDSIVSVIPIIVEPVIEEPVIEEPIIEEPIIEEPIDNIDFEKVVSMDIKDLMKEIIAEDLLEEATLHEVVPTVSDRKLRKRRKKSL